MLNGERLKYVSDNELNSLLYRAKGDSTRLVDDYVQEFFTKPMGTKIYVSDHYGFTRADNDRATVGLITKLCERIEREHHCKFKQRKDINGYYIVREEPTFHECVEEEIKRRQDERAKV